MRNWLALVCTFCLLLLPSIAMACPTERAEGVTDSSVALTAQSIGTADIALDHGAGADCDGLGCSCVGFHSCCPLPVMAQPIDVVVVSARLEEDAFRIPKGRPPVIEPRPPSEMAGPRS